MFKGIHDRKDGSQAAQLCVAFRNVLNTPGIIDFGARVALRVARVSFEINKRVGSQCIIVVSTTLAKAVCCSD